jgi:hypothetical protein
MKDESTIQDQDTRNILIAASKEDTIDLMTELALLM